MSTPADELDVVDLPSESRFVIRGTHDEAELVYSLQDDRLILVHTEVPQAWSGHGVGGLLVRAALRRARAERLTIVPWCPYARRWLRTHPDETGGVEIDYESPRPAA
jgi:predicted GNAT family acetyltransferase